MMTNNNTSRRSMTERTKQQYEDETAAVTTTTITAITTKSDDETCSVLEMIAEHWESNHQKMMFPSELSPQQNDNDHSPQKVEMDCHERLPEQQRISPNDVNDVNGSCDTAGTPHPISSINIHQNDDLMYDTPQQQQQQQEEQFRVNNITNDHDRNHTISSLSIDDATTATNNIFIHLPVSSSSGGPHYKDQVACRGDSIPQSEEHVTQITNRDAIAYDHHDNSRIRNDDNHHPINMMMIHHTRSSSLRKVRDFIPSQRIQPNRSGVSSSDGCYHIGQQSSSNPNDIFTYETGAEIVSTSQNELPMIHAIAVTIANDHDLVANIKSDTTHHNTATTANNNIVNKSRNHIIRFYAVIIFIGLALLVIMMILCIDGSCRRTASNPGNENTTPQSSNVFTTKIELMNAVDDYLSLLLSSNNTNEMKMEYWDVSLIQDFSSLFDIYRNPNATYFHEFIGKWNISSATNMSFMFRGCTKFQSDLSRWDVSNVIDMKETFYGTTNFDSDLSNWNVTKTINMTGMFQFATAFRGIGLEQWNTSNLQHIDHMFHDATNFNGNISVWDVSKIRNMSHLFANASMFVGQFLRLWNTTMVEDMSYMFANAIQFSDSLSKFEMDDVFPIIGNCGPFYEDCGTSQHHDNEDNVSIITHWNTRRVITMEGMFCNATSYDGPFNDWDVSNVMNFESMFSGATNLSGIGIEYWNTSQVTNMKQMFQRATKFTNNFDHGSGFFDTSKVTTMAGMFDGAIMFNGNVSVFDVSHVEDMSTMFRSANTFMGAGLETWNTRNVMTMREMFHEAYSFDADLSSWDVSHVYDMSSMFSYAYEFDANLSNWNVSLVQDMSNMFMWSQAFRGIGLEQWQPDQLITTTNMFSGARLFNADLSRWDMSKTTVADSMFSTAISFTGIGIDQWNTSRITSMSYMFFNATSFDANLSNWDVSQVTNMENMFNTATSFQGIGLENWNTHHLHNVTNMFSFATSFRGNISTWNVSSIDSMESMFDSAIHFDGNLSEWDVSRVSNMFSMFANAISFHGDGLEKWNTTNVINMDYMFYNAQSLIANLSNWDVSDETSKVDIFFNTSSSLPDVPWDR